MLLITYLYYFNLFYIENFSLVILLMLSNKMEIDQPNIFMNTVILFDFLKFAN